MSRLWKNRPAYERRTLDYDAYWPSTAFQSPPLRRTTRLLHLLASYWANGLCQTKRRSGSLSFGVCSEAAKMFMRRLKNTGDQGHERFEAVAVGDQNDDGDGKRLEVLLEFDVLVGGEDRVEFGGGLS